MSAYTSSIFSLVSGDWLTLVGVMVGILSVDWLTLLGVVEGIVSDDLLTPDSMQRLPCFVHSGISFLVTAKQVCNTSIWKEAPLDRRLGDEFAFVT